MNPIQQKHKCWEIEKGKKPNPNHYRFVCYIPLVKKWYRKQKYKEIWSCWNDSCNKKVEFISDKKIEADNINISNVDRGNLTFNRIILNRPYKI